MAQEIHPSPTVCPRDGFFVVFAGGFPGDPTFPGPEGVNESGDASVFAEADARLGLDDDCDSGWGASTEAKGCACRMGTLGVSVFLSA